MCTLEGAWLTAAQRSAELTQKREQQLGRGPPRPIYCWYLRRWLAEAPVYERQTRTRRPEHCGGGDLNWSSVADSRFDLVSRLAITVGARHVRLVGKVLRQRETARRQESRQVARSR